jgi:hypothetical protein
MIDHIGGRRTARMHKDLSCLARDVLAGRATAGSAQSGRDATAFAFRAHECREVQKLAWAFAYSLKRFGVNGIIHQ